jgi:hypothetical protein
MAKTKRYNNFREFYEDESRPKKMKPMNESQKQKDKFRKVKYLDPNDLDEDDYDELDEYISK